MGLDFPRSQRLLKPDAFRFVFQAPKKLYLNGIILFARKNETSSFARLGMIIAKRDIPKANQRNKYRRLIRETFRHNKHDLGQFDFIVMVKRQCLQQSNQEFMAALETLWERFQRSYKKSL